MEASIQPSQESGGNTVAHAARPAPHALFARFRWLGTSLSKVQTVVGLMTGMVSICGALLAVPSYFAPPPEKGRLIAVVEDAKTGDALSAAKVEILTTQNAVLTTISPNFLGNARINLEAGRYRVRVSHAKFATEVRQVHVVRGETTEVRVQLRSGAGAPLRQAGQILEGGVGAVRRLFGQ